MTWRRKYSKVINVNAFSNFEKYCEKYEITLFKYNTYQQFCIDLEQDVHLRDRHYGSTYFDLIENELIEDEKKLLELLDSYNAIHDNLETLIEKREVVLKSSQLIGNQRMEIQKDNKNDINKINKNNDFQHRSFLEEGLNQSGINFIAGTIKAEDDLRMKRMVFRISKGRAVANFWDLEDQVLAATHNDNKIKEKNKNSLKKKIFTIIFQSGVENVLQMKILKVCDIFLASRYNIPKPDDINNFCESLNTDIGEKQNFLYQAENSIKNFIKEKSGTEYNPGRYPMYRLFFRKERMIFMNLNKCILRDTFIDGEVWILAKSFSLVMNTLKGIVIQNETKMTANLLAVDDNVKKTPPTYIPVNDFLYPFQEIVDTYGVPRYQEINPAYFNIVTFPFLFGIMFGDIGHGFVFLLFGSYLCLASDSINREKKSPLRPMLKARYLLFLMGLFAFYCGWLYNDFISIPIPLFDSCYENINETDTQRKPDCTYYFGLDPKWYVATNELSFMNSMKMKLSVIFGVLHMTFGIILRGCNSVFFKDTNDLIFQVIPQFIFMTILFGYMNFMIFFKWGTDWTNNTHNAPSLISTLMKIFISLGSVEDKPLWGGLDKHGGMYVQEWFHLGVLGVALICIPLMLFPKPILEHARNTKRLQGGRSSDEMRLNQEDNLEDINQHQGHQHDHEVHSFGDLFVHQLIETIEFVLGSISNTASYLRLWALSLAHGQLSQVFFKKSLADPIAEGNIIMGVLMVNYILFIYLGTYSILYVCFCYFLCFNVHGFS